MPEILTDAYLLFTFVFKQALNVLTKGANIKTVSSLLGHTSIKMTERMTE